MIDELDALARARPEISPVAGDVRTAAQRRSTPRSRPNAHERDETVPCGAGGAWWCPWWRSA